MKLVSSSKIVWQPPKAERPREMKKASVSRGFEVATGRATGYRRQRRKD